MLEHLKAQQALAGGALCCLAAAAAVAGPPTADGAAGFGGGLLARASALTAAMPLRNPGGRLDLQRLDLRPPETLYEARVSVGAADDPAEFPSAKRAQPGTMAGAAEDLSGVAPDRGADWVTLRMESKVQEMERRVPREGLPIARLWETKTALLHIGLSPRGKPGLWLFQKVR
jgi:hypothetical protein